MYDFSKLSVAILPFFITFYIAFFLYSGRREMSSYLVNNVIENATCIPTSERVDTILTIVATLVQDQKDGLTAEKLRLE